MVTAGSFHLFCSSATMSPIRAELTPKPLSSFQEPLLFPKVDIIVVADGHQDEVGSAAEIALATHAKVITSFEMYSVWFEPRKVPLEQIVRSSPGDWYKSDGITIRNIGSIHGSGTADKLYGVPPWGS